MLFNPSFELEKDGQPVGWELIEKLEAGESFLTESNVHSGRRALLFSKIIGRAEWRSEPILVKPERKYALSWWTYLNGRYFNLDYKDRGKKRAHYLYGLQTIAHHWNYFTKFVGAKVTFLNAKDTVIGKTQRRIYCLETEGWRRAWLIFRTPKDIKSLTVSFIFESELETDGEVLIDDVELEDKDKKKTLPNSGLLYARIIEAKIGRATSGRVYIKDKEGNFYYPEYSYTYDYYGRGFYPLDGSFEIELPPGSFEITILRGFEYEIKRLVIKIREGEVKDLTIRLNPKFDLRALKWFSGDHHLHLFFHRHSKYPHLNLQEVMKIAKCEGLNYLSFSAEIMEFVESLGKHEIEKDENFVGEVGLEVVNDLYGHICILNINKLSPLYPLGRWLYPMNLDLIKEIKKAQGAVVYSHPYTNLSDPLKDMANPKHLTCCRELPLDLALGEQLSFDLLCAAKEDLLLKLRDYYRLLNLGFRLSATASSDYYQDQGRTSVGTFRTYVRCEELNFEEIAKAYLKGATFATNGPLLEFKVEGKEPGEEVYLEEEAKVLVELKAYSLWEIREGEIIINGESKFKFFPNKEGIIKGKSEVEIKDSGWIVARVSGPAQRFVNSSFLSPQSLEERMGQFAHTSPVYISFKDRPIKGKKEDAIYFLEWLDTLKRCVDTYREEFLKKRKKIYSHLKVDINEIEKEIESRFLRAREIFQKIS